MWDPCLLPCAGVPRSAALRCTGLAGVVFSQTGGKTSTSEKMAAGFIAVLALLWWSGAELATSLRGSYMCPGRAE